MTGSQHFSIGVAVPTYKDVFIFAILVAFLVLRPRGIFSAEISEKV
jgi:hypothetical protein